MNTYADNALDNAETNEPIDSHVGGRRNGKAHHTCDEITEAKYQFSAIFLCEHTARDL